MRLKGKYPLKLLPVPDQLAAVGGTGDFHGGGGRRLRARHQRTCAPVAAHRRVDLFGEFAQLLVVVEVDAHGIVSVVALRTVDLARQGDAGVRDGVERVHGLDRVADQVVDGHVLGSEEHTSELQSLMRISYAVFCLKKKKITIHYINKTEIK